MKNNGGQDVAWEDEKFTISEKDLDSKVFVKFVAYDVGFLWNKLIGTSQPICILDYMKESQER